MPTAAKASAPTLCLPEKTEASFTDAELRMIVIHETMHMHRLDGYLSWLLTVVRAVHWFNPIAWFTIKQIETYREQACDDAVRRFTEPQQRGIYTDLLLRFASRHPAASLGLLGLWFARPAKRLTARIEAFSTAQERLRRLPRLFAVALVFLLAVVGLTDAIKVKATAPVTAAGPSYLPFTTSESSTQLTKLTRASTEIITPTTIEAAHALTRDAKANNDAGEMMINPETLELKCRLTISLIDEIGQVNLPRQNVTVQIPRAKRRSILARCQIQRGETLLIAPNIGKLDGSDQSGDYYAISTNWFADPVEVDGYDWRPNTIR